MLGIPGSCFAKKLGLTKSRINRLNRKGEVLIKGERGNNKSCWGDKATLFL